jgi:hypothetical protein
VLLPLFTEVCEKVLKNQSETPKEIMDFFSTKYLQVAMEKR